MRERAGSSGRGRGRLGRRRPRRPPVSVTVNLAPGAGDARHQVGALVGAERIADLVHADVPPRRFPPRRAPRRADERAARWPPLSPSRYHDSRTARAAASSAESPQRLPETPYAASGRTGGPGRHRPRRRSQTMPPSRSRSTRQVARADGTWRTVGVMRSGRPSDRADRTGRAGRGGRSAPAPLHLS